MGGTPASPLMERLLAEILRDGHRYVSGLEHRRPTQTGGRPSRRRRFAALLRECGRDAIERMAARAGFARRHFDPQPAAAQLSALLAAGAELDRTYSLLGDELSRRALIEVLKFRVLGPYHASLGLTAQQFRSRQGQLDRDHLVRHGTFEVSDPWFTPLSLYRLPGPGRSPITLHGHSVDLTAVYLLEQYRYRGQPLEVAAQPGDVVLDVGGCWGDTALYFAERVGPKGKVFTFEFDPESLRVLRENLVLNPRLAERIEVVELALWDRTGESLPFISAGRMTSIDAASSSPGTPRTETSTLDDFVAGTGIERVGFLKVDVEGAEGRVLEGGRVTLRSQAPRLAIAAYHDANDLVRLPQVIESLDVRYRLYLGSYSPVEEETVLFAQPASG